MVERLFAWLQSFRRIAIRYERHAENFLGFVHLGCLVLFLRALLEPGQFMRRVLAAIGMVIRR